MVESTWTGIGIDSLGSHRCSMAHGAKIMSFTLKFAVVCAMMLSGCASRQPSSTDRHSTIPSVTCGLVTLRGGCILFVARVIDVCMLIREINYVWQSTV